MMKGILIVLALAAFIFVAFQSPKGTASPAQMVMNAFGMLQKVRMEVEVDEDVLQMVPFDELIDSLK
jgi:hypothetical protein